MTEQLDWGSEANAAPKAKKRIPTWAWFCGGGCLLALLLAVAGGIAVFMIGRKAMNQEEQWAKLAEVLPFDAQPADTQIVGMSWVPGVERAWQIQRRDELIVQIFVLGGSAAEGIRKEVQTPEDAVKLRQMAGLLGESDSSSGTLSIQGRDVTFARFTPKGEGDASQEDTGSKSGFSKVSRSLNPPTVMLDLSKEGSADFVLFSYKRLEGRGPVTDEELLEFLAPFHIGPNR